MTKDRWTFFGLCSGLLASLTQIKECNAIFAVSFVVRTSSSRDSRDPTRSHGQGTFSRQPNDEKSTEVVLLYATSKQLPAIYLVDRDLATFLTV
ncbi:hypothetical protein V1523DRAFT_207732 [Lipomyces doorenjongii]